MWLPQNITRGPGARICVRACVCVCVCVCVCAPVCLKCQRLGSDSGLLHSNEFPSFMKLGDFFFFFGLLVNSNFKK